MQKRTQTRMQKRTWTRTRTRTRTRTQTRTRMQKRTQTRMQKRTRTRTQKQKRRGKRRLRARDRVLASRSMSTRFAIAQSPYSVPFDGSFRIRRAPTAPPKDERDEDANEAALEAAIEKLQKLQARLLANDRKALLLVFQAMDAAGKDGTIKAVMTGINPAGCEVYSFKKPSHLELDHDFLWRIHQRVPERGRIGIFNRSHYEEVIVVKVHPEILDSQPLPDLPARRTVWDERYESIRDFEKHLARNGTTIIKFFLHVGKDEQKKRFLDRIAEPESNWKFQAGDVRERAHFDDYMKAYEEALNETSRPWAPWYAVPADDKDFMRRTVAEIVVETMAAMDCHYPEPTVEERKAMLEAKKALESEGRVKAAAPRARTAR